MGLVSGSGDSIWFISVAEGRAWPISVDDRPDGRGRSRATTLVSLMYFSIPDRLVVVSTRLEINWIGSDRKSVSFGLVGHFSDGSHDRRRTSPSAALVSLAYFSILDPLVMVPERLEINWIGSDRKSASYGRFRYFSDDSHDRRRACPSAALVSLVYFSILDRLVLVSEWLEKNWIGSDRKSARIVKV
jgi:hypothetical protein